MPFHHAERRMAGKRMTVPREGDRSMAQPTDTAKTPLTRLNDLVGTWRMEVRLTLPDGSTQAGEMHAVGEAISLGQGIRTRLTGDLPGLGPVEENDLWGYDVGGDPDRKSVE